MLHVLTNLAKPSQSLCCNPEGSGLYKPALITGDGMHRALIFVCCSSACLIHFDLACVALLMGMSVKKIPMHCCLVMVALN